VTARAGRKMPSKYDAQDYDAFMKDIYASTKSAEERNTWSTAYINHYFSFVSANGRVR
jgi:hypothetical protein